MMASPANPTPVLMAPDTMLGTTFLRAFLAIVFTIVLVSRRLSALLTLALTARRAPARANHPQNPPRWFEARCRRRFRRRLTIFFMEEEHP